MPVFQGFVYDLDFIANSVWLQIKLPTPDVQLVVITEEPRKRSLLELLFLTRDFSKVAYSDGLPNVLCRPEEYMEVPRTVA